MNQRKFFRGAIVAAAALILTGTVLAVNAGDSLISLSYLNSTYIPTVVAQGYSAADEKLTQAYHTASQKLEELNGQYQQTGETSGLYSADLRQRDMSRGDQVALSTGAGLLPLDGTVSVTHSGAVIDVTAGQAVDSGAVLTANHRYLVGEDTSATFQVESGMAAVGVQGGYTWAASGEQTPPFTDVSGRDWYCSAVDYVYFNHLFSGTGTHTFSPTAVMNRSMIVTVFYNMAGAPQAELSAAVSTFSDVALDQWYAPYVAWAADQSVTSGTGNNLFSPDQPVTRRQVVTLLYSFASNYLKMDLSQRADLSVYEDAAAVSDWGGDAMAWAVATGLLSSTDPSRLLLSPNQSATRAQVAVILQNFSQQLS